ncbi:MAG: UDP-glucose/GDP-mannose dehydrogenase family protein [Candidatus Magnetoovum sp. WYHC-5]|nr:UDP-glucose/GDP-mannose dehydrogenase family protein [Candidatus Magnetoovum sp. WYHC-5]
MDITIVGTGYVGLVTGTCFAQMGNNVICVDVDENKINSLKNGIIPIYEPGLELMVKELTQRQALRFTTNIKEALVECSACFIAVGTPMEEDGSADLKYVLQVAREIGRLIDHYIVVVNKSTVPVGTAEKVRNTIEKELISRGVNINFDVVSNPEFLKEGAAVEDFTRPDRVVIGTDSQQALEIMKEIYAPFTMNHDRLIIMDVRSAEMTKYAANAMLATKISFMNEIANICECVGADVNKVRIGIGSDKRIGYSFIYPGAGYGGSCFPKDVKALQKLALEHNYHPKIITAIEEVNEKQKLVIFDKIIGRFGNDLTGLTFAIWGLSFKPETDDMREAASLSIVTKLIHHGAHIKAYDPKAMDIAQNCYFKNFTNIEYVNSKYVALFGADALILITEWKEFRSPDIDEIAKSLKNKIIFDCRNQYNSQRLMQAGFEYYQIGVRTQI